MIKIIMIMNHLFKEKTRLLSKINIIFNIDNYLSFRNKKLRYFLSINLYYLRYFFDKTFLFLSKFAIFIMIGRISAFCKCTA